MTQKKKHSLSSVIACVIMAVIGIICLYFVFKEVSTTLSLRSEINSNATVLKELKKEKVELNSEKQNLENPDYLVRYASGKYMVTGNDGEQVFKLPSE